ncbi:hypothetical protein ANN_00241 [Periplaneta americana]|uniref:HTH CENPB-type domain-containing protein n=1 Tax=Periplaneta americana TaxID=6978 RepID=A0ABQ8TT42_PERAM|nr:hypothetical protein ANN_00241 [Periplaneta americana]
MGTLKASKIDSVPRTTLQTLSKKTDLRPEEAIVTKLGRKPVLGFELEKILVEYVLEMEEKFYGLTRSDLQRMAYALCIRNGLPHPFTSSAAGRAWLDLFLERHSNILSIRRPCGASFARALGFNKENVDKFFQMLEAEYDKFHYTPDRIYNVDEIGVTVMQNKVVDVISRKGKRQIASMTAAERGGLITVIFSMSVAGNFIPPMMIFPRKNMNHLLIKG